MDDFILSFTPTLILPRPRDKTCRRAQVESLGIFDKGEEIMRFPDELYLYVNQFVICTAESQLFCIP